MQFTRTQLKAIAHARGQLQLIACAGSGKTEVISQRVARLLRTPSHGRALVPANIVAFTFSEKAAAELKARIYERCREENRTVTGLAEMYVGTIHGFCLDLLRSEVPKFLKYEVMNAVQQVLFIDRYSRRSGMTDCFDLNGDRFAGTSIPGHTRRRWTSCARPRWFQPSSGTAACSTG